jgi:hypothetical protein
MLSKFFIYILIVIRPHKYKIQIFEDSVLSEYISEYVS